MENKQTIKDQILHFKNIISETGKGDFTFNIKRDIQNRQFLNLKNLTSDSTEKRLAELTYLLNYVVGNTGLCIDVINMCREHHQKHPELCCTESTLKAINETSKKLVQLFEQMQKQLKD